MIKTKEMRETQKFGIELLEIAYQKKSMVTNWKIISPTSVSINLTFEDNEKYTQFVRLNRIIELKKKEILEITKLNEPYIITETSQTDITKF